MRTNNHLITNQEVPRTNGIFYHTHHKTERGQTSSHHKKKCPWKSRIGHRVLSFTPSPLASSSALPLAMLAQYRCHRFFPLSEGIVEWREPCTARGVHIRATDFDQLAHNLHMS